MRRLALILATLAVAASASLASAKEPVLVFAAASTRDAMQDAIAAFEASGTPSGTSGGTSREAPIKGVYAASSALARQILDGAPASIFLSANIAWADVLDDAGRLEDRRDFLRNRLVIAAPVAAAGAVAAGVAPAPAISKADDIVQALGDNRLAMGETRSVPVGQYGRQALINLGVWEVLRGRVARASNARTALLLVERGETPLGIVYASDARASSLVTPVWSIPSDSHAPIVYPLALVRSDDAKAPAVTVHAKAFMGFLASPTGRAIFSAHGFEVK